MFAQDDVTSAMHREATALSRQGLWDDAVKVLYAVRDRMIDSPVSYPVDSWCRLPLYLQKVGRFEESMAQFDWLIDDLPRRAAKETYLNNPNVMTMGEKPVMYENMIAQQKVFIESKRSLAASRQAKCQQQTNQASKCKDKK